MPTLHERLKRAREDNELSVTEVSRIIGVKPDSYRKWESGEVAPRANKLMMLAGVFSVPPAWLLDGDEDYLQALDRDQKITQLRQRLAHMQAVQNRMLVMLDELTSEIDEVDSA
ncbi:MAG: helix-turn-helix transcriptional regulator [Pseudomonadota bacterium]